MQNDIRLCLAGITKLWPVYDKHLPVLTQTLCLSFNMAKSKAAGILKAIVGKQIDAQAENNEGYRMCMQNFNVYP